MFEHLPAADGYGDEKAGSDDAVAQRCLDELEKSQREGCQSSVECLEEAVFGFFRVAFLEKDCAERRREREGDEAR